MKSNAQPGGICKGFGLLAVDTVPFAISVHQPSTHELSTGMESKAIYRQGDDRVGQWSDVVSIAVAG